jgi:two-component system, sensor histidine kinase LadS
MLPRILFASLVCLTVELSAQTEIIDSFPNEGVTLLTREVTYYLDSTSSLPFEKIKHQLAEGNFHTYGNKIPNYTNKQGIIWFSFSIKNTTTEEIAISFPNIFIEDLKIFISDSTHLLAKKRTGFLMPFNVRDFAVSHYVVLLAGPRQNQPLQIIGSVRANSRPPMLMLLKLGTLKNVLADARSQEFISIAILGVMLVMLFYNFCLYLIIRDRLYIYYCFYICTAGNVIMWFTGLQFEWFWPMQPHSNPYPWAMGLFNFGQLLFANKLLQLKITLPQFHKVSMVIYLACFLIVINAFLPVGFTEVVIKVMSIALPLYLLGASIILCLRKTPLAYIFLLGWLPILLGTMLNILMINDVLDYNALSDNRAIEIGLVWEVIIFSLALGYRFNIMRGEKLEMQAENLRIINEQKSTLKKLVFEQTEEMLTQNDQLIRNQEEIKLQNERLETQNKAYERLKEMILRQNHELENSVQRRTLQLAQSNEELKRYIHQLEQFSFIAAHNLRAPVARILGLANIIDVTNLQNPENHSILQKLVLSAMDLDIIIHDLGAILEAQKNKGEKTEAVDINSLIEKIINRFKPDVDSEGIIIERLIGAPVIHAIPAYLDSIFSNLISNAIKYRAETRRSIILIATEESDKDATIIIHDNGIGFDSKQVHRKLFEPFQRFHTHKEGKGLGMFLVKTQVTAMEGTITLTSEADIGTHVIVTLPK